MKKWLLSVAVLATVTACSSSNESRQVANDSYEKNAESKINFSPLATGGVTIVGQDNKYQLPTTNISKGPAVDIRPPTTPMSIIGNSVAQFDGERASIVYPAAKSAVYNLDQVARLLKEENIEFTRQENKLLTDWAPTGRVDEVGDVKLRYLIEQLGNKEANALSVTVLEAKRNEIIFTPSVTDKQRYTSDRLNNFVGNLNHAYRTQMAQTAPVATSNGAIQAEIVTDGNNRTALGLTSSFAQSWEKLGQVLPELGFEIDEETAGRGYRVLKYKPVDDSQWARLGVNKPELEKGEYSMQLSAYGNQSAVVLMDEDKAALEGDKAQAVYKALQVLMTK
ncbi:MULTISPECIES: outer membrane protein assembly factor BamC [Basfia]|uniref:Outer membrane protein assembly factor BamC n=1 Tax=Mannheimia succiniciproducens (strain KCTC 0769BP / MBEL55E) TaxID=221988 RepID=Q65VY6_MANSM|nr:MULTISPECIES: outer membrane protein assembly factor BamC [Basfia]AAU36874.1 NlpB protein [[Mannheimia] succiniciproducens MBEL55E]SEQ10917.1 Beta-barrel assembly machine subunit BamC [Basfia succiniciproducens]